MYQESSSERPVMAWMGGRPVYADKVRQLADIANEYEPQAWNPANLPAQKLFRCVECLRDIEVLLQTAGRSKNKVKQRRKLKILHTPLHSLVEAIRDLTNDLENNPDTVRRLPDGARELVPQLRSQLLQISTIEKGGLLSTTRDKIAAHVDRELSTEEMRILLSQADSSRIGLWLHACISVLCDLIKLPAYFWSCQPEGEGSVRILFEEPFVVTLGLDSTGKANRLLDIYMVPSPPRYDVVKLLMRVVKYSKWMFKEKGSHIMHFVTDEPGDSWAKSLHWLPRFSGSPVSKNKPSVVPQISTKVGPVLLIPSAPFFVNKSLQRVTKLEDLGLG